jgi:hypothetical protein
MRCGKKSAHFINSYRLAADGTSARTANSAVWPTYRRPLNGILNLKFNKRSCRKILTIPPHMPSPHFAG